MASTGRFWSLAGVCALAAQAACGVTDEALLVRAGDPLSTSTTGGVTGGRKSGTTGSTAVDSGRGGNGGRTTTGGGQSGSLTSGGSTTVPPGPQGPLGPQLPDFDAGPSTLTRLAEGLRIVELPFGPIGDASVDASDGFFGMPAGGICSPCLATDQCGVTGAYCVENTRSGEHFCTRPCSLDVYCPDYFECVLLSGAPTPQCVPNDRSCGNGSP